MEFNRFKFLEEIEIERDPEKSNGRRTIVEKPSNDTVEPIECERDAVNADHAMCYKQGENVIRKTCKVFVEVQAVQNKVSQILFETNLRIKEQIEKEKKYLEVLKLEQEKINLYELGSCVDLLKFKEFISKADEIKQYLQEQATVLLSGSENINTNLEKLLNRNQTFEEDIKTKLLNIQRLKKAIENEMNLKRDHDDSVKKENLCLKQVATDLKKQLEVSKAGLKEEQKQHAENCKLKEEKEILHNKLKAIKGTLIDIQNQAHQDMVDKNFIVNSLQQAYETKKQGTVALNCEIAQTIKATEATKQSIGKLEEFIENKRLQLSDLEVKMVEMKKYMQEMETKLDLKHHKNLIEGMEEKIASAERNLAELLNVYDEKVKEKEQLQHMYALKLGEKHKLAIEREATIKENQMALVKNKLLDEKIAIVKRKIRVFKEKLNTLADEPDVEKLSKQKTYLDDCNTYFKEHLTILEKDKVEAEKDLDLLIKQNNSIKTKIEECEKELQAIYICIRQIM